ncbi:MAG: hypothetical protein WCV69_04095 [Patescibacteria group bacterium]|jgi:hypothetical protein
MPWHSFKEVANKRIKKGGLEQKIFQSAIVDGANQLLLDWFGAQAGLKSRAVYVQGTALVVAVLDKDMAFYLETREKDFIAGLNILLKKEIISDLILLK